MSVRPSRILTLGAAAVAVLAGLAWSGDLKPAGPQDLIASAHAIVGRPLTPMSYAGVARRTTRRAVVAAPVVHPAPVVVAPVIRPAPVVVAPAYYPPECVRVVDAATGRVFYRCP